MYTFIKPLPYIISVCQRVSSSTDTSDVTNNSWAICYFRVVYIFNISTLYSVTLNFFPISLYYNHSYKCRVSYFTCSICSLLTNYSWSWSTFYRETKVFRQQHNDCDTSGKFITFICILHVVAGGLFSPDFMSTVCRFVHFGCCRSSWSLACVARQPDVWGGVGDDVITYECKQKWARGPGLTTQSERKARHAACTNSCKSGFYTLVCNM